MTSSSFNDVDLEARRPVAEPEHRVSLVQAGRFPVLDAAQLALLRAYGTEQDVAAGEVLFAEGDETYDLIVVLDGAVQIVGYPRRPEETVIATYGPGHFLGEIGLLTGQRAFATAVARTAGRILRVPAAAVRAVMAQDPGLSELLLRTFLIRHGNLTTMRVGLTLIGSRFDADTRRIPPFPPLKERFERLEETLQIAHQMWADNQEPFHGKHYQLERPLNHPRCGTRSTGTVRRPRWN